MISRWNRSRNSTLLFFCCRTISTFPPQSHGINLTKAASLNIAIVSGSTRTEGPPRPILGKRVNQFMETELIRRGHQVSIIDPREVDVPLMQKPHFAYAKSQIPSELETIHHILVKADGYVVITPEYNHSPSPGLLNILNHFGSSTFGFKPSAIVSYSAGQWGGTRAAHALRPFLSELGCLPVSAMVHIPKAQEVLEEGGKVIGDESDQNRWSQYVTRCISQLEWWGDAAKAHRQKVDPFIDSPSFVKTPSQRNAPLSDDSVL